MSSVDVGRVEMGSVDMDSVNLEGSAFMDLMDEFEEITTKDVESVPISSSSSFAVDESGDDEE